jgi:radical SAM superfamily enzyme YgiQ (UPF0313 family)
MDLRAPGAVLFVSCYELGHQPLAVASPLGFLHRAGFPAAALDIAVERLDPARIERAGLVAISVPMHTALRLGVQMAERVRQVNPHARICFYGLYAALNADYLLDHVADYCVGGECEGPLVALAEALQEGYQGPIEGIIQRGAVRADAPSAQPPQPYLGRLLFPLPVRTALPPLEQYAKLEQGGTSRVAGYVEASRGCKHLCTHCPIPPVYGGRFFVVPADVVLDDVRNQVAGGATHITFGDPDFLNGPGHALKVIRAVHAEFPRLTFDFTAKIEHILKRRDVFPELGASGVVFMISAVESLSDTVLTILDKNHTRADVAEALAIVRDAGIAFRPTWVPFTPWTTRADYCDILDFLEEHGLIDHVDPVQYTIRLLVPPGSYLMDHAAFLPHRGELNQPLFSYRWTHPDPDMDRLQRDVAALVEQDTQAGEDTGTTFYRVKALAEGRAPQDVRSPLPRDRVRAPRLSEPWFC